MLRMVEYHGHLFNFTKHRDELFNYVRDRPAFGFFYNWLHHATCKCGMNASWNWDDALTADIWEMADLIDAYQRYGYADLTLEEYMLALGYGIIASRPKRMWHWVISLFTRNLP